MEELELEMKEFNCGSYSIDGKGITFHNETGLISIRVDNGNFRKIIENYEMMMDDWKDQMEEFGEEEDWN